MDGYIVTWLEIDPDVKTNGFNWYRDDNDLIFPEDQYYKEFKNDKVLSITVISVHSYSRRRVKNMTYA